MRDRAELRVHVQHVRTRPAASSAVAVSRSSDALEALFTDIARRFAYGVLEAVCAASITELREAGVTPPGRAVPRSSPRSARGSAPTGNVAAVVAAVRAAGDAGIAGEKLRAALDLSRPAFHYAMGRALETNAVRKTGRLRGMRYFAA